MEAGLALAAFEMTFESLLKKLEVWVLQELVAVEHEEEAVPFAVVHVVAAVGEGVAVVEVCVELVPVRGESLLTTEV